MKRIYVLLAAVMILASSCGPKDKQAQLEKLKKQRDDLNMQIATLEKELEAEGVDLTKQPKHKAVNIAEIKPNEFNHYIEIQGNIESDDNIFIPAESPGVVEKIYVKAGDKVSKGQLLAELNADIYLKSIAELKNGLELATTVYDKQKKLWDQKIGSEIQYLQAKNTKEGLEKKLATVMEQYDMTKIKSPISGTVDEIAIKEGEMAMAGFGAIRVVKLDDLKLKASLSEDYIDNVKTGDIVKIFVPSLDSAIEQEISAVSNVINPDTRTFTIEVKVPTIDNLIKPNMLAVLKINDYSNSEAVVVPLNVVQKTADSKFLFIVDEDNEGNMIAKRREVKVGKNYNGRIEILENLKVGEKVIVTGFQELADGDVVKINK
jgi:membrane fusion protein (multidrug efflux system)